MGEVRKLNPGDWLYPHVQVRSYMLVEAEQDPAKANPLEYAIRARRFIAEKTGL